MTVLPIWGSTINGTKTYASDGCGEGELGALAAQLDEAYRRVAANLPRNADIRIERVNGKDRLSLTGLDKLEEPPSLSKLRDQVDALLGLLGPAM